MSELTREISRRDTLNFYQQQALREKAKNQRFREALEKIAGPIEIPCRCWLGRTLSTNDTEHADGCVYRIAHEALRRSRDER